MENRKIRWHKRALNQFNTAIIYIAQDSLLSAENVRQDILNKIIQLSVYPAIHPPDRYKKDNNGNFRAFELHRYRISYHISDSEIRILRVRHTGREPKMY